jgi:ABC-type nitrate/sulfonate/bicarbonate transport system ATPase subunit
VVSAGGAGRLGHLSVAGVAVQARGVTKVYATKRGEPVHALDQVSLETAPGEFVSMLGPSGCGKSTMLMLIAGLIAPSQGEIRVAGEPLVRPRTDASVVFQRDVLLDWRSVLDNVLLPVEIKRLDRRRYGERARELPGLVASPASSRNTRASCRARCASGSPSVGPSSRSRACY